MRPESPSSPDPRIDDLTRRIAAIEERLGIVQHAEAIDRVSHLKQAAREFPSIPTHPPVAPGPPVAPPLAADETGVFEAIVPPAATPPAVAAAPPVAAPVRAAVRTAPAFNLEKFVGLRLFAAVGALGLVIGVVLFLKLAIDSGWLRMPPAARCVSRGGFRVRVAGRGEIARRKTRARIGRPFGRGHRHDLRRSVVRVLEVRTGQRSRCVRAARGIIGRWHCGCRAGQPVERGNRLAGGRVPGPNHRGERGFRADCLPSYLLALVALGLGLSALRPKPFRPLRAIVWWATAVFGTGAAFGAADAGQPLVSLAFLGLFWGAVHAELWHATRGVSRADDSPPVRATPWRTARPIITTFGTTMWCARSASGHWSGPRPRCRDAGLVGHGGLLLACGAIALVLAGNLRA